MTRKYQSMKKKKITRSKHVPVWLGPWHQFEVDHHGVTSPEIRKDSR